MSRRAFDPYAPQEAEMDGTFRTDRWRRAGADDEQLALLEQRHGALSSRQQVSEGDRIDSMSDGMLTEELDHLRASAAERKAAEKEPEPDPEPDLPAEEAAHPEPAKKAAKATRRHRG